jgi:Sigma-70, region 4
LAFVTALQVLPARQRAVLILREVLGYHAHEVAEMLDSTVESVNSALKRARTSLQRRLPPIGEREPPPDSPAEQALVAKFVRAYASGDVDALVALLTAECLHLHATNSARIPGPRRRGPLLRQPHPPGPDVGPRSDAGEWLAGVWGLPRARAGGIRHGTGLLVLTLTAGVG